MTEGRARAALVTGPILGALVMLLGIGLFRPSLIDPGPGVSAYRLAVGLEGTAAAIALAVASARSRGRLRLSWAALALMAALWTVTVQGALGGVDGTVGWNWLRGAVAACGLVSLVAAPGVRRTAHEWGLVVFDGWLVGASVFVLGWVMLAFTGSLLTTASQRPSLAWLPFDLLFASVTAGLAMRTGRSTRTPVLLMLLASLLVLTADTTWALTGEPYFPAVQWLIMMHALLGASTSHELDLWRAVGHAPASPRLLRWSQVAVVPGLVAGVTSPGDPVVVAASVSVVLGMAGQILLISRQNQELWTTLRTQARRLDQVLRDSGDAILQLDESGVVEFANEAAAKVLGWPTASLPGLGLIELSHPEDLPATVLEAGRLDQDCPSVRMSGRFRGQDGRWRCLEATVSRRSGDAPGFTVLARDVSDQVLLQSELRRLASTDPLTGLANRHHFITLVTEHLAGGETAVLFLDLDGFKQVNDILGHAAGDRLLQDVARALRTTLGPDDVAARLGGDEFAVLSGSTDRPAVEALAVRIADRLAGLGSDAARRTSASVGVAVARNGSAETLLGDADLAMYEAKAAGGGRHAVFEPAMRHRVTEQDRVRAALERACTGNGLRLDVQPVVAMDTGTWTGFEALLRWRDGSRIRRPEDFLPLAEQTGLVVPIGDWVLRTSLAWLAGWPDPSVGISVNVTARQVSAPGFTQLVTSALEASEIAPGRLTLEITEQTAVEDLQRVSGVLQPLRALGVHVSLDDFGTGFSCLGYLARLPVDELKIDRRFVAGLGARAEDDALVRAVTGLAADLGLRVVAEGVETPQQARRLLDRGCTLGQGHHFHAPIPATAIRPPTGRHRPWVAVRAGRVRHPTSIVPNG